MSFVRFPKEVARARVAERLLSAVRRPAPSNTTTRRTVLAAVALLMLVPLVLLTSQVQAQTPERSDPNVYKLVGNLNEFGYTTLEIGQRGSSVRRGAVKFTTGDWTAGYELENVALVIRAESGSTLSEAQPIVTIREPASGNANNPSDTVLYTLTSPSSLRDGVQTFTAPDDATLDANSDYFIVMENASTGTDQTYGLEFSFSGDEDPDGLDDWEIADESRRRDGNGSWRNAESDETLKIAVNGARVDDGTYDATGQPVISGRPHRGETLTAGIGSIIDIDGLPAFPSGYRFQWIRVSGSSNEEDIFGATGSSYQLGPEDVGNAVKVKVSFVDLDGNDRETLTSNLYPFDVPYTEITELNHPAAKIAGPTPDCPDGADWCTIMTVGMDPPEHELEEFGRGIGVGEFYYYADDDIEGPKFGDLRSFFPIFQGKRYVLNSLYIRLKGDSWNLFFETSIDDDFTRLPFGTTLTLDDLTFTLDASTSEGSGGAYRWEPPPYSADQFNWAVGQRVRVALTAPPPPPPPSFYEGESTTREVTETVGDVSKPLPPSPSQAPQPLGGLISAESPNGKKLFYYLREGDATRFTVDRNTGQLSTRSGVRLRLRDPEQLRADAGGARWF